MHSACWCGWANSCLILGDLTTLERILPIFWADFVLAEEGGKYPKRIHVWPSHASDNLIALASIRGGDDAVFLKPTLNGVLPFIYMWRIQRLFRRKLAERRVLAVMMGTHWRLGAGSALGCLPVDVVAREIGALLLC